MRALWNGAVIADSSRTIMVEGNHYFPPDDVERDLLENSPEHTFCPWKGTASYYDLVVGGGDHRPGGAVWYYPEPMAKATAIQDYRGLLARRRGRACRLMATAPVKATTRTTSPGPPSGASTVARTRACAS